MALNGWSPVAMFHAVRDLKPTKMTSEWKAYAKRLHELGVFGESVTAGDLEAIRTFASFETGDSNEISEYARFVKKWVVTPAKGVYNVAKKGYELEDNFYRMMAFESEKGRYAKAYYGKPFDQLTPEEVEYVESVINNKQFSNYNKTKTVLTSKLKESESTNKEA